MRQTLLRTLLAAALVATLAVPPASASNRDPESFASRIDAPGGSLELCSTGVVRRLLMRALAAGLYREDCGASDDVLGDAPKALEIAYFWSIEAADFARAGEEVLRGAFSVTELAPLRDRIEQLHAAYRDVEPGDRYRLTYLPGRGTELALNGTPLVVVPGADFARAYFSIWLGERPADVGLRTALLASPNS